MIVLHSDILEIHDEKNIIFFRKKLSEVANRIQLSALYQTKLLTAASELVRNILKYGKGGEVRLEIVSDRTITGIRIFFEDKGPGIPDIEQALKEGYSSGKGLGLGLPGARKLVDEFDIKSTPGKGTTVKILMWKHGR